jgi:hypothetical protein
MEMEKGPVIDVTNKEIKYQKSVLSNKKIRILINAIVGSSIILTIGLSYWKYWLGHYEIFFQETLPVTIITVFIEVIALVVYNLVISIDIKEKGKQVIGFNRNTDILVATKSESEVDSNFNRLVKINLDNLSEFYETAKSHSSRAFYITIISSVFALVIIALAFIFGVFKKEYRDISYLTAGSGMFIELVSGLLFIVYNKTIQKMKEYHESLVSVQNALLSFKIINEVTDQDKKIQLFSQLIELMNEKKGT